MENFPAENSNTKIRIIEATSDIMSIKGVKETSLADIAKAVGISKGTLYYHYSSKDDIIYDIADQHLIKITEELMALIDSYKDRSTPEKVLIMVLEKIINAETRGKLHLYLLGDAIMGNASLKQRFHEKYKEWHKTLNDGLKRIFEEDDVSYDLMSQVLLAMLDGFLIQKMIGIEQIPLEGIASILTHSILKE